MQLILIRAIIFVHKHRVKGDQASQTTDSNKYIALIR